MAFSTQLRPTLLPEWASGVSGAARIVEPTQTEKNLGWQASQIPPSTYFNWFMNGVYQWMKYLDDVRGAAFIGDQSDGDLFLTGATRYMLQKHGNFRDVAIGPSGILDANGWGIRARIITGVSGVIQSIGGDGATGVFSTALINSSFTPQALRGVPGTGPMGGAFGDGTGYIGTGNPGYGEAFATGRNGIQNALGGDGGSGGVGIGGVYQTNPFIRGGTAIQPSGFWSDLNALLNGVVSWGAAQSGYAGSVGVTSSYLRGGAGGAFGAAAGNVGGSGYFLGGGAGGAGGGYLPIAVGEWNLQGKISVRGGAGGWGMFDATLNMAGSCGGGGGGGGKIVLAYGVKRVSPYFEYCGGSGGLAATLLGVSPSYAPSLINGLPGITGGVPIEIQLP